jgi:two-component system, chemotaxis family, protein-glutamate methylesterase/glutaminase
LRRPTRTLPSETPIRSAQNRDITVIGASAGGLAPLRALLGSLPTNYPAAVFVVVHLAPETPSVLADILDAASRLPVVSARSGAPIRRGTVTVAPADCHLVLTHDTVLLSRGPRENRHRPSIDVLFRSAAVVFGPRVTGVVLSGLLDDGSVGLWGIKRRGGITVVQDPDDAEFPDMPRNAMEAVAIDVCAPANDLAERLVCIAGEPMEITAEAVPPDMARERRTWPLISTPRWKSSTASAAACRSPVPNAEARCGSSTAEAPASAATSATPIL